MKRGRNKRPFYKKSWFWTLIVVIALGIGYGSYQITRSPETTTTVQDDHVTKSSKKKTKKSHSKTKSSSKQAVSQSQTTTANSTSPVTAPSNNTQSSQSNATTGSSQSTTDQTTPAPVVEKEPNSIIGDASTMTYYLPGQDYQIAEGNMVYFDYVTEAEDAGYHPAN